MRRFATLSLLLALAVPTAAGADDTETLVHAVNLLKTGAYADAAREFYDLASGPKGPDQEKSEYYLAECFYNLHLLESAFYFYAQVVKEGPKHPKYADSLVGLVKVDEQLGDDALIPSILNKEYDRAANIMGGRSTPRMCSSRSTTSWGG